MAIDFFCASCAKEIQLKDELAGKKIRCPGCQTVLTVPGKTAVSRTAKAAPVATPARSRAPSRAARPAASRSSESAIDESEEPRPRFQRHKKRSPILPIIIGVALFAGILFPVLMSQRAQGIILEVEADYENARRKLKEGDQQQSASILGNTVTKIESLAESPENRALLFKHRLLYAEALIATMSSDKAMKELERAEPAAESAADKAKIAYLKAKAHPNQTEFAVIAEYYKASLAQMNDPNVAREALNYIHALLEAKSTQVVGWVRELRLYEEDAVSATQDTVRTASAQALPAKRALLMENEGDFNNALATGESIVESVRRVDPGMADNYLAMFRLFAHNIEDAKSGK